jgi:predicted permease
LTHFLLLTVLLLGSAAIVRRFQPPPALADSLNWWVIYVALPATVLELLPGISLSRHLWFLVASQWLVFTVTVLLFRWVGARLGWSRARTGAITLMAALNNTSFVGFPLLEALRGPEGVALGVIADQLGGFLALAVGGSVVVGLYSSDAARPAAIVRKVLTFPAFIAVLVGLGAGALGGWPDPLPDVLHRIAQTLAPLALFAVGLRLRVFVPRGQRGATALALGWKLALMPLLTLGAGVAVGAGGLTLAVAVMETAMAPMFTAAILARQHDFEPELTDTVLSLGLLLSFLTVPAWNLLL